MVPEFLDENIRVIRELIVGHFRILYRIKDKIVEVLRIIDSRQLYDMNID
jgi:mRNA-degrading endonuclease RelE of RelBE toxin-antitoxin system